jgi:hypothetical protein
MVEKLCSLGIQSQICGWANPKRPGDCWNIPIRFNQLQVNQFCNGPIQRGLVTVKFVDGPIQRGKVTVGTSPLVLTNHRLISFVLTNPKRS